MARNLEDRLRLQFNTIQAVGQISTPAGEEVLCTSDTRDSRLKSSRLAAAFIETDQLAQSLKLGAIRQVIISQSCSDYEKPASNAHSVVQSKTQAKDYYQQQQSSVGDSLVTTTIASSLQNALIGDNVIRDSAQRVLR